MSEKLPKPILEALARQATPDDHPPADLLAGFAERALSEKETNSISHHLASCAECREVVFLASSAGEPVAADVASVTSARTKWWTARWLWAAPVAAVLLVVAGIFGLQQFTHRPAGHQMTMQASPPTPVPLPETQEVARAKPAPAAAAPTVSAKPRQASPPAANTASKVASRVSTEVAVTAPSALPPNSAVRNGTEAPKSAEAPEAAMGGPIAGAASGTPAVPRANGFAPSQANPAPHYDADSLSGLVGRALTSVTHMHPGWRISPQGHLEQLTPDGWVRALADQPGRFRVVSVLGSDVWAGGNGGMLFHSSDNGRQWNKLRLTTAGGAETAAIVSIRFDDSQHGEVVTDAGISYSTSDGGANWSRQ
jgi:hypothetical protein